MPPQAQPPLLQRLLLRPYHTASFQLTKRVNTDQNGKLKWQMLDIVDQANPALYFTVACRNYDADQVRRTERREHYLIKPGSPVGGNGNGQPKSIRYATAVWEIERTPTKIIYKKGTIGFSDNLNIGPLDDFIQWKDSTRDSNGRVLNTPPRQGAILFKNQDGSVESFNIELTWKSREDLVMDVMNLHNNVALKLFLTFQENGSRQKGQTTTETEGTLDIISKGLQGTTQGFQYLREFVFYLWLIYVKEDRAYIEEYCE